MYKFKNVQLPSKFNPLRLTITFLFLIFYTTIDAQGELFKKGDTIYLELVESGNYSIQWQMKVDSISRWTKIPAATTNPHLFIIPDSLKGRLYIRAKTNYPQDTCPKYSKLITINVINNLNEIKIGTPIEGGIVYYTESQIALISATKSLGMVPWGCKGKTISGADSTNVGWGFQNTQDIINSCNESRIAARICDTLTLNNYDDWHLPSKDELQLLVRNLNGKFNFNLSSTTYWSSSEINLNEAWRCYVPDSMFFGAGKDGITTNVHPIRKINISKPRKIKYTLEITDSPLYTIEVNPINSSYTNVKVLYTGDGNDLDRYQWDFGKNYTVINGFGIGPYEISYNYGGYININLKNLDNKCSNLEYSDFFRVPLFDKKLFPTKDIQKGDMQWGDYDNDNFKDILITGSNVTSIYKNFGGDSFVQTKNLLPSLQFSSCDWGDYNNDGFLDFAICGYNVMDSLKHTYIFKNQNNDSFSEVNIKLPGVDSGFVKFVDLDNNGKLELIVSGAEDQSKPITKVYAYQANDKFIELNQLIPNLKHSSICLGDYNQDGYNDLLITGNDGNKRRTIIMKNLSGKLVEINSTIISVDNGDAVWGDFNNDGLLDIAIQGLMKDIEYIYNGSDLRGVRTDGSNIFRIYLGFGGDQFTIIQDMPAYLRYSFGKIGCADYDNDGLLDLAISGVPGFQIGIIGFGVNDINLPGVPRILKNYGNDLFSTIKADIPSFVTGFGNLETVNTNFICSDIKLSDFNNDGKVDLYRDGDGDFHTSLYTNHTYIENKKPTTPSNLNALPNCNNAIIKWGNSSDDHTPTQSITYEIYIGSSPDQSDILSKANTYTIRNTHFVINDLSPGTYYWSVKAIDQAQSASAYAPEQSFTISAKPTTPVISFNGSSLLSNATVGNQWYDQNGPIPGATLQSFIPALNGNYYVIVSSNGCQSDTSNKIQVILSANNNQEANQAIKVYPNPVEDVLTLESSGVHNNIPFEITNSFGQLIYEGILNTRIHIPTKDFPAGLYTIKFQTEKLMLIKNLIKE